MCYLRPYKVKKIENEKVLLDNGIKAHYNKRIGTLRVGDMVQVFGNVIIEKIKSKK